MNSNCMNILVKSYLQYMQKLHLQELKQTPALYLIDKTIKRGRTTPLIFSALRLTLHRDDVYIRLGVVPPKNKPLTYF